MLALEPDFVAATLPLFEADAVEALSFSVDFAWMRTMPEWAVDLVRHFGANDGLFGHAIHYSTLSALPSLENVAWLDAFTRARADANLRLLSAHFGLSVVPGYVKGAPLPVPFGPEAVRAGRHWMSELQRRVGCAVGLENLALAFSKDDCERQGAFLAELVSEIDGFVTLDVHNVYCQAQNFELDPYALLASYPLARVRELHVSGGSVGRSALEPDRDVRQDTHDDHVPAEVFDLAAWVVARAPALEAVFLERLGGTFTTGADAHRFREDYGELQSAVARGVAEAPLPFQNAGHSVDDGGQLASYEASLVRVLASGAPERLAEEAPAVYRASVEAYEPRMLDLGAAVVREWFEEKT